MEPLRKKGKTIHSEGREIVRKVIAECDEESRNNTLKYDVKNANKRISNYTGVSERTISRIRRESRHAGDSQLQTPGKHRPRPSNRNVTIDSFDMSVIRNVIYSFFIVEKKSPTCKKLLPAVQRNIGFPWGVRSLNRVIRQIGFCWKKFQTRRKVLIERPHIVEWRFNYLKQIHQFRKELRPIIYIDECWVDSNLTYQKCWPSEDTSEGTTQKNSNKHLIVVGAGFEDGFLEGTTRIFEAGQMNVVNFEKWVRENLLCLPPNCDLNDSNVYVPVSNIPANSVIVMDNAPYHCIQINKPPSKYALKYQQVAWLQLHDIKCSLDMRKCELNHLIELNKPTEKVYQIDELLRSYGHTVLRLPPRMSELSAIELAWAKVLNTVRECNITGDFSLPELQSVTEEAINGVTKEDWMGYCYQVQQVESEFWEKDGLLDNIIDNLLVSLQTDNSEHYSSDEFSSSESEDSDIGEILPD